MNNFERYGKNKFRQELIKVCHMYLLHGVRNGSKKVEYHFAISNIIYELRTGKINKNVICSAADYRDYRELLKIHDSLSNITSNLDKVTKMDVYNIAGSDYDIAGKRLFNAIIKQEGISFKE